ncbi:MAG TPA: PqqD family protein [Thermodesulfobacteriota bacterium]|nr:PqqD family protein [Thermodesulfobacteriota bacterium]
MAYDKLFLMKYSVNSDVATWRVLDGEAVIINNQTSYYYSLNRTGTFVWNLLIDNEMTLDEIVENVSSSYELEGDEIRGDITAILDNLYNEKLLERK